MLFVVVAQGRDSPADEMQKFIDECNYMIEEMNHCAEGWVNLEQEMVDSVNSFADNIVFTETLILEETELILDMADRIIQTEEIMIDLVESCDCSSPVSLREIGKHTQVHKKKKTSREKRSSSKNALVVESTNGSAVSFAEILSPNNESAVSFDKCSVMDEIIDVMDACIDAFVVYNDDFLQVLSYMDAAILDMGKRIVNTECLIVNMSYQIGDMADLVVETEVLMADMAASCCRGAEDNLVPATRNPPLPMNTSFAGWNDAQNGDDDLLSDCNLDGKQHRVLNFNPHHAQSLVRMAREKLQHKLQLLPPVVTELGQRSYLKRTLLPALALSSPSSLQDVMPCDTWWDPFCCAAEVCADMMVAMIEMMADGADWMEQICKDCIDEMGQLADAIVKTEENIILMGYAIQDMAEYMVVFIDEGLEFMVLFCPNTKKTYSLRGNFQVKKGSTLSEATLASIKEGGGAGLHLKTYAEHMSVSQNQTVLKQSLPTDVSKAIAYQLATAHKIKALQSVRGYYTSLKENPFGEFVAMVDVMMEAMMVFTDIMTDQTRLMTELFQSLVSLSTEEAKMAGLVVSMGEDVINMGSDLQEQDALMDDLDECI